jgi:inorganic pyrophosphatase
MEIRRIREGISDLLLMMYLSKDLLCMKMIEKTLMNKFFSKTPNQFKGYFMNNVCGNSFMIFLVLTLFSCLREKESIQVDQPPFDPFVIQDTVHFLHGYPALVGDSLVNVVIEIPTGTLEKWEVNKVSGYLELPEIDGNRRMVDYLGYPGNYGMIPQTLQDPEIGGDGDPLDVLILGPPLKRGSLEACRIIGILRMLDYGELDDKLIAIPANEYLEKVTSMEDLQAAYPGMIEILTLWFENYKQNDQVKIIGLGEKHEAFEVIQEAISAYRNQTND